MEVADGRGSEKDIVIERKGELEMRSKIGNGQRAKGMTLILVSKDSTIRQSHTVSKPLKVDGQGRIEVKKKGGNE